MRLVEVSGEGKGRECEGEKAEGKCRVAEEGEVSGEMKLVL